MVNDAHALLHITMAGNTHNTQQNNTTTKHTNNNTMAGLAKICKMYGSIEVTDEDGKKITWLWDYANDKPRLKTEMTNQ